MTKAADFMEKFMRKLNDGKFVKDNQPNNGPMIDEEYIKEQVESYTALLKSGIIESITG